jgi:acetyltransferase
VAGVDVNPLLADADGVIALDARVEIDPDRVEERGPNRALAIRPYPSDWEKTVTLSDGDTYLLRPIRPQDVTLYPPFLSKVSADDIRLRFLAPRRTFPHEMLVRLTQLDYDRDMAFVALSARTGELVGIGRLSCDPDRTFGEYALLVRTDLQGHGLGWALLDRILAFARSEKVGRVEGIVLSENTKMLAMVKEFGFDIGPHPDEPGLFLVRIDLT